MDEGRMSSFPRVRTMEPSLAGAALAFRVWRCRHQQRLAFQWRRVRATGAWKSRVPLVRALVLVDRSVSSALSRASKGTELSPFHSEFLRVETTSLQDGHGPFRRANRGFPGPAAALVIALRQARAGVCGPAEVSP